MKLLEDYITQYGEALSDEVLKVDCFLNHQVDASLMMKLAEDFKMHFQDVQITKVMTIEASGIAPAAFLAYLLHVPLVYLKKNTSKILHENVYTTSVHSFTKDVDYEITCSRKYISAADHVLFIDDFMANGEACLGAIDIIEQAQATISGIGIVIEKAFQNGQKNILEKGYAVYSQARIASLAPDHITFCE